MRTAAAAGAALAALVLVACGGDAKRGESGDVVDAGNLSVFSFHAGDCFNSAESEEDAANVTAIPCDEPHEAEVYLLADFPAAGDAPYPGVEAVEAFAEERCAEGFEPYVGLTYDRSSIYARFLYPTSDSWEQ